MAERNEEAPLFTKTLFDSRVFGLLVGGVDPETGLNRKLWPGDKVTSVSSVSVTSSTPDDAATLVVAYATDPISENGEMLFFQCADGQVGAEYLVSCRFVSGREPRLESLARVCVT